MAGFSVTGDQFWTVDGRMSDIKRQLSVRGGSPLDPNKVAMALQAITEGKFDLVPKAFLTWRTVRIGVHKSLAAYLAAAEAKGHKIGTYAAQILPSVEWAQEESDLELVEVLDSDAGMVDGYTFDQLAAVVTSQYDLELLPAEAGPAVRDQYLDQPMDEWRGIAMKPRADSDANLLVFSVGRRSDGTWLNTCYAHPAYRFNLGLRWLFARRKRPASQG